MTRQIKLANILALTLTAFVGILLGLQMWDRLSNLFHPYWVILCAVGWLITVSTCVWKARHATSDDKAKQQTFLAFVGTLWFFSTLGAMGTFYQGLDYMTPQAIILGSAYLAAIYNFMLVLLPLFVLSVVGRKVRAMFLLPIA